MANAPAASAARCFIASICCSAPASAAMSLRSEGVLLLTGRVDFWRAALRRTGHEWRLPRCHEPRLETRLCTAGRRGRRSPRYIRARAQATGRSGRQALGKTRRGHHAALAGARRLARHRVLPRQPHRAGAQILRARRFPAADAPFDEPARGSPPPGPFRGRLLSIRFGVAINGLRLAIRQDPQALPPEAVRSRLAEIGVVFAAFNAPHVRPGTISLTTDDPVFLAWAWCSRARRAGAPRPIHRGEAREVALRPLPAPARAMRAPGRPWQR